MRLRRFPRHRRAWRRPRVVFKAAPDATAHTWIIPTVSKRRLRWLGRLEVYPHRTHLHVTYHHRDE